MSSFRNSKLYIHDKGDPSVGIFAAGFSVDVPFPVHTDKVKRKEEQTEDLEWFRKAMYDIYAEFCQAKPIMKYDFEREEEEEQYAKFMDDYIPISERSEFNGYPDLNA